MSSGDVMVLYHNAMRQFWLLTSMFIFIVVKASTTGFWFSTTFATSFFVRVALFSLARVFWLLFRRSVMGLQVYVFLRMACFPFVIDILKTNRRHENRLCL